MNDKKLGFALCGSFCTLERTLQMMAELVSAGWEIQPIMSPITYGTDTRFGTAEHWRDQVEALCGRPIWHTVAQVEPIGPRKLLDILLVAPCTGNTLAKLAHSIAGDRFPRAVKAAGRTIPAAAGVAAQLVAGIRRESNRRQRQIGQKWHVGQFHVGHVGDHVHRQP